MLSMGQIGFRRVLPALFTLIHIVLLVLVVQEQREAPALQVKYPAAHQEGDLFAWDLEPKPLTLTQELPMLLNLPSVVLAIPFALTLLPENGTGSLYAALPFVPMTWWVLGKWIDALMGYVSRRQPLPRSPSGLLATLSTTLLILSVCTMTPINHHRRPDTYWVGTALLVWSGLSLAMSLSSYYRDPSQLS